MTERMSSEDFQRQFGKTTKKAALVGQAGMRWFAKCGHDGWSPTVETRCPVCGEPVAFAEYKRATAKQAEEYEGRNA